MCQVVLKLKNCWEKINYKRYRKSNRYQQKCIIPSKLVVNAWMDGGSKGASNFIVRTLTLENL